MMTERQYEMWDALSRLDGETVLKLLTEEHSMRLLDEGLYLKMKGAGYLDKTNEEDQE